MRIVSEEDRGCGEEARQNSQPASHQSFNHLRLLNSGTDCFVNFVLQLLSNTGYATYLANCVPSLLELTPADSYMVSRHLAELYSSRKKGLMSTAHIRTCVAEASGKLHLDVNSQEDAEEFLLALVATIAMELETSDSFKIERENHWG